MRYGDIDLIGISGKAGSGKDYLATHVLKTFGYNKVCFSWPLKLRVLKSGVGTFEEVFITKPTAVRAELIRIGTEERELDPDHWVKQLRALMELLYHERGETQFCITDVRFLNEAAFVRSLGGKLVRMKHAGLRAYPLAGTKLAEHASECALDHYGGWQFGGWDAVIDNFGHSHAYDMLNVLYDRGVLRG
jgi:hypothetical protein